MVYQGLVNQFKADIFGLRVTAIFCLAAAMFGSGLTLASFMKLIHATFLGQRGSETKQKVNEVSWQMWLPTGILAIVCIIFGVFANQIPLRYFILPAVEGVNFIGTWYAGISTLLIILGLILGFFIFQLQGLKPNIRQDTTFTGGESLDLRQNRVTGTDFYNTIKEIGIIKTIYAKADKGAFDIYEQGKNLVFSIGKIFQFLHNGVLPTYLVWYLLGMLGLFYALFFR
jgi:NADH:ubiquinone oxidoreductase subunit 5 (subunit L)/multisubunit Na+/H+ antiporter MnhA subunit